MANYSFKTTNLPEPIDGVIERHNFTQGTPHTKIYEGYSGLTFRMCNLLNCDVPAGSIIEDCLRLHVSYCSHLYPEWLAEGYISECAENCEHVTHIDNVTIDGVVVDQNYSYEDKGVA